MDNFSKRAEIDQSNVSLEPMAGFGAADLGIERAFNMASQALGSLELAKAILVRSHISDLHHEAGEIIAMVGHLRSKILQLYELGGSLTDTCAENFNYERNATNARNAYEDANLSDASEISRDLLYTRAQKRLPGLRIPSIKILMCFIASPSEIIPIEVLAKASGTSARTMEIIKVYMSSLRKSLDSVGFDNSIITHSKRGYSICPVKSLEIVAFLSE